MEDCQKRLFGEPDKIRDNFLEVAVVAVLLVEFLEIHLLCNWGNEWNAFWSFSNPSATRILLGIH